MPRAEEAKMHEDISSALAARARIDDATGPSAPSGTGEGVDPYDLFFGDDADLAPAFRDVLLRLRRDPHVSPRLVRTVCA